MHRSIHLLLYLFLLVPCISCGGSSDESRKSGSTDTKGAQPKQTTKQAAPADNKVTLKVASWDDTLKLVEQNKGKVVVVDVWSTVCPPCMKEFPHLVELHHKYEGQGNVVCISLSLDNDGTFEGGAGNKELQAKVLGFLKSQKAVFQNFICSDTDEEFYSKQKPQLGTIPAVFVFAPDGKLKERFDDGDTKRLGAPFSYQKHVFPMVAELVKTKP